MDGERSFDCWAVSIGPGEERPVVAGEWVDAMVLVDAGDVDVVCEAGGTATYHAGDLLALSWLRARNLINHGATSVKLVGVRRSVR